MGIFDNSYNAGYRDGSGHKERVDAGKTTFEDFMNEVAMVVPVTPPNYAKGWKDAHENPCDQGSTVCAEAATELAKSSGYSAGSSSHEGESWLSSVFGGGMAILLLGASCVGLTFGAIWVNQHSTAFSFLWWLSLVVGLVSGYFTIQILLGLAVVVGVIWLVVSLIEYFVKHPW